MDLNISEASTQTEFCGRMPPSQSQAAGSAQLMPQGWGRGQWQCPCGGICALGEELLAGEGVVEELSSCTLLGRMSKRSTGSLQRLNSPEVPSKWNYSMIL